ncbi:MAG: hypothetical protein HY901_02625 [Deltaproteobacteria bacterium]|nr:hypothetical protein [Deltaproteobacteria bacterium]
MVKLLIVEDLPDVGRAYVRSLRHYEVAEVILATTPSQAEEYLVRSDSVCLMCDHWLGPGQPTGSELIHRWKETFPNLGKAVLVTGSDSAAVRAAHGVDAVFEKPPDLDAIAAFFGFAKRPRTSG